MKYSPFQIISHTADIQLAVQGRTWIELITNTLKGTFSLTRPHVQPHALPTQRMVNMHDADREILLVKFLSECLYLSAIYHEVYIDFQPTQMDTTKIVGHIIGSPISSIELEIKAVTYHELAVTYHHDLWHAHITYDI